MPNPVDLQLDWLRDVVADELKTGMANPAGDVGFTAGEVIIETDNLIAALHQSVDQMGAEEAGTSCDEVDLHP